MNVKIPYLVKRLFSGLVWEGPDKDHCLYLTFDDGPIPEVTPWVLEELKKYDAKATFFCIGDNIRKHPEVFKKVISEGHTIGNHTFNHLNGWKTRTKKYLLNTQQCREVMEKQWHQTSADPKFPELFRPPYGKIRPEQVKALKQQGFEIVMWEVLSQDYDQKLSGEKCFQNVIKNAGPGSIIVFHDSLKAQKNVYHALPKVLDYFSKQGYTFKAL